MSQSSNNQKDLTASARSGAVIAPNTPAKLKSYDKVKSQADQIKYELPNQGTIMLRRSGTFWKAVQNSAALLRHFGITTAIRTSRDQVTKRDIWEMSIHCTHLDKVKAQLAEHTAKILRDDNECFVILLHKPLTPEQLDTIKNDPKILDETILTMLSRNNHHTAAEKTATDIFITTSRLARALKGQDSNYISRIITDSAIALQQAVRVFSREDSTQSRHAARDAIDNLQNALHLIDRPSEYASHLFTVASFLNQLDGRLITPPTKTTKATKTTKNNDEPTLFDEIADYA
ncbi:MAG: hypothetical protein LBM12_03105 [Candidatus Nomurabacteria bacterium]|jgi:hypothetical protein|nr:hypothetical protein [Candidatus Nomurabacteria bacterium]